MKLVFGHDELVVRWLEERWGSRFVLPCHGIGVIDDAGELRAAHILQPLTRWTAEWSLYSEQAMTHGVIRQFFRYAFEDLGLTRIQIRTAKGNKAIHRAANKSGFRFEGVARGYWGPEGGDAVVFGLTRDQCRWLRRQAA